MTSSVAEEDTAEVQTAAVELDSEQIALYRGNREYQTITVEHFCIGITGLLAYLSNCCMFSVNVCAQVFETLNAVV